jgi:hypothetical protein
VSPAADAGPDSPASGCSAAGFSTETSSAPAATVCESASLASDCEGEPSSSSTASPARGADSGPSPSATEAGSRPDKSLSCDERCPTDCSSPSADSGSGRGAAEPAASGASVMLRPQRGSKTLPSTLPAGSRSLVPTETLRSAHTSTPRQPSIEEHGQPHNYTEQYSGSASSASQTLADRSDQPSHDGSGCGRGGCRRGASQPVRRSGTPAGKWSG